MENQGTTQYHPVTEPWPNTIVSGDLAIFTDNDRILKQ